MSIDMGRRIVHWMCPLLLASFFSITSASPPDILLILADDLGGFV